MLLQPFRTSGWPGSKARWTYSKFMKFEKKMEYLGCWSDWCWRERRHHCRPRTHCCVWARERGKRCIINMFLPQLSSYSSFPCYHDTSSSTSSCSCHHYTSSPTSRHHSWYNTIFLPFHQLFLKVGSALLAWAESIHPVRENIFRTPTFTLVAIKAKQSNQIPEPICFSNQ